MSTNADLYDFNIQQSLAKFIRASDFVTEDGYTVNFEDTQFNPSSVDRWVTFEWVYFGARVTSQNSFHARCFNRKVTDRFGKLREVMIGRLKETLAIASGIDLYDFITAPSNPTKIDSAIMAIRFGDRSALMDASEMMESSSAVKGVDMVVLSYNAYIPRVHEIH